MNNCLANAPRLSIVISLSIVLTILGAISGCASTESSVKAVHRSVAAAFKPAVFRIQLSVPALPVCPEMLPVINCRMEAGVPVKEGMSVPMDQQHWPQACPAPKVLAVLR